MLKLKLYFLVKIIFFVSRKSFLYIFIFYLNILKLLIIIKKYEDLSLWIEKVIF